MWRTDLIIYLHLLTAMMMSQPRKKNKSKKHKSKRVSNSTKKSNDKSQQSLDKEKSFDFGFDDEIIEPENNSTASKSPTSKNSQVNSLFPTSQSATRQLFVENSKSPPQDFVSMDVFRAFETKLYQKLNILQSQISEIIQYTKTSSSTKLVAFPAAISDVCTIPAVDIRDLETLDKTLADKNIKSELASYLSQLGGKSVADFLGRALPKLISDEVCFLTNWSGSFIPPGSLDAQGCPITREHKKTFSNLTDIVEMLCASTRLACPGATDKQVEAYIQKWLLSFKDRISPRKHQAKSNKSPKKTKKSPKKNR